MKFCLLPGAGLLIALALTHAAPIHADAAVGERIQALSLRIEQDPDNQALHLQRSLAYALDNQPQRALVDIEAAEALDDPVRAALTHGILLSNAGDYVSARAYFDRYLNAYPQHLGALKYRARLLRDTGKNRAALADYETLITLSDSLDPGYYIATARLMASLPDRGTDDALALLDARMAQLGPLSALQRYAIELERNRGHYHSALQRMGKLDQRLKATPQWQVEVAELLLLAGQPHEALPYLALAQEQLASAFDVAGNTTNDSITIVVDNSSASACTVYSCPNPPSPPTDPPPDPVTPTGSSPDGEFSGEVTAVDLVASTVSIDSGGQIVTVQITTDTQFSGAIATRVAQILIGHIAQGEFFHSTGEAVWIEADLPPGL